MGHFAGQIPFLSLIPQHQCLWYSSQYEIEQVSRRRIP